MEWREDRGVWSKKRSKARGTFISLYFCSLHNKVISSYDEEIKVLEQRWDPIIFGKSRTTFLSSFFVDDSVLFSSTTKRQTRLITSILDEFCLNLRHKVSNQKTEIFFSSNISKHSRIWICDTLGFDMTEDLGRYLGVPMLH